MTTMAEVDLRRSSLPIRPFPISLSTLLVMSSSSNLPERAGHEFSTFFQDQQKEQETPFLQTSNPQAEVLRMDRKDSNVERDVPVASASKADLPLWRRLPTWVPIVCWISTSSFVILQNKYILSEKGFSHPVVSSISSGCYSSDRLQASLSWSILSRTGFDYDTFALPNDCDEAVETLHKFSR